MSEPINKFYVEPGQIRRIDPYVKFWDVLFILRAPSGKIATMTFRIKPRGWFRRLLTVAICWLAGIEFGYEEKAEE